MEEAVSKAIFTLYYMLNITTNMDAVNEGYTAKEFLLVYIHNGDFTILSIGP